MVNAWCMYNKKALNMRFDAGNGFNRWNCDCCCCCYAHLTSENEKHFNRLAIWLIEYLRLLRINANSLNNAKYRIGVASFLCIQCFESILQDHCFESINHTIRCRFIEMQISLIHIGAVVIKWLWNHLNSSHWFIESCVAKSHFRCPSGSFKMSISVISVNVYIR